MKEKKDQTRGLAEVAAEERYYTTDGRPVGRRLVRILADMVEFAMKRVRRTVTDKK
jgi:hypothetical protein